MSENQQSQEVPLKSSHRYYRTIFNKYDRDHDGFINVKELNDIIKSREYEHDIPKHVVKEIHVLSDRDGNRKLDLEEFVEMMNNPQLQYVFGQYMQKYINWVVPPRSFPTLTVIDGIYEEEYNCNPPAVGMILISIIEIIFFCVDEAVEMDSTKFASGPTATLFIYEPDRRREAWRFITYMFVHIGVFHLVVNLLVQILLGVPLEMVHKWWRVLIVYFAGVLAGSLGTSISDPTVKLAGASGGVYSLITAHVASIVMNWNDMSYPAAQLLVFLLVTGSDIGQAIYNRYVLDMNQHIGYAAHFAGGLAGLLVGINVLRNLTVTRNERILWWISMITYLLLMGLCIIWNLACPAYFPEEKYN